MKRRTPKAAAAPDSASPPISGFAMTHCAICAAGWTRRGRDGGVIIVCLLDREPVWPDMEDCDRYERREDSAP